MREVLFRGKQLDDGKWVEGHYAVVPKDKSIISVIERKCDNPPDCDPMWKRVLITHEVDPETVCQYTGLTDKNGKKIFEGDIVKGKFHGYEEKDTITWNERTARFVFPLWDRDEFEVIGNIFDNLDLTQQSNNAEWDFGGAE